MCAKNKYDTECKREKGVENDNIQSDLLIIHFPSIFFLFSLHLSINSTKADFSWEHNYMYLYSNVSIHIRNCLNK